jgi:hypothetical protein
MISLDFCRLAATTPPEIAGVCAANMFSTKPSHRMRQIRRLYRADEDFRAVWDDYLLVKRARRHFSALGESGQSRAEEFRLMHEELAEEISNRLKRVSD